MIKTSNKCPVCQSPRIFYENRRIPTRDGFGELAIGILSCPLGHKDEIGYCVPAKTGENLK